MEEKILKKMQNKFIFLEGSCIAVGFIIIMLRIADLFIYSFLINYIILAFIVFGIILIYYTISYKSKIEKYKKDIQKLRFEKIEKEIGKYYKILDFSDEEFEIFAKEAESVAYDKYYLEESGLSETYASNWVKNVLEENKESSDEHFSNLTEEDFELADDIPGEEKDYVEGYEEFEKSQEDLDLPKINIKYVTEFERKGNKVYLMSFEEIRKLYDSEEKFISYVLFSNIKSLYRLHIESKSFKKYLEEFDDIYYNYEKIIKDETYELGNRFLKLKNEEKHILVNLYNETKLKNSIVIKDGKIYIRIEILERVENNDTYKDIAKLLMEVFERFLEY